MTLLNSCFFYWAYNFNSPLMKCLLWSTYWIQMYWSEFIGCWNFVIDIKTLLQFVYLYLLSWAWEMFYTVSCTCFHSIQLNPKNAKKICIWKCSLFMLSAEYSCKFFKPIVAYRQTVWTLIRLLLEEQSDLGPHCLQKWLLKSQADDSCCDWQFKG